MMEMVSQSTAPRPMPARGGIDPLMQKAQELEAAFLAEMLGYAGLQSGEEGSFSGGAGEAQFASFLRAEQARLMVENGGIGLAETLFRAMGGGAVDAQS